MVESGGGGFVKGIRLGVIKSAHGCLRPENHKFKANQRNPARSYLKTQRESNAKKKNSYMKAPSVGIKLHFCKPFTF